MAPRYAYSQTMINEILESPSIQCAAWPGFKTTHAGQSFQAPDVYYVFRGERILIFKLSVT